MNITYSSEVTDFINKVFNYYNGRINVVNNKAILNINWKQSEDNLTMGDCTIPNVITIYPVCIMCDYTDNELKMMVIETIIHELHHADQLLDYRLCKTDRKYVNIMEAACESQTAFYLLTHKQELYDIFGVYMHPNIIEYYNLKISSLLIYSRKCYHDHIFECISDLYDFNNELREKIYYAIINNISNNKSIIICINDKSIYICNNGILTPLEIFNNFVYRYVYADNRYTILKSYINNDKCLYINMQIQFKNIMCFPKEG